MSRVLQTLLWLAVLTLGRPAAAARLEITIEPVFQGAPLRLDSPAYQNAAGETLSVTRLSYLLSGFALEGGDGQWVEVPDTHALAGRRGAPEGHLPAGRACGHLPRDPVLPRTAAAGERGQGCGISRQPPA